MQHHVQPVVDGSHRFALSGLRRALAPGWRQREGDVVSPARCPMHLLRGRHGGVSELNVGDGGFPRGEAIHHIRGAINCRVIEAPCSVYDHPPRLKRGHHAEERASVNLDRGSKGAAHLFEHPHARRLRGGRVNYVHFEAALLK